MHNQSGNSNHKNKVIIRFGSDSGKKISACVNGSGNSVIKIPFLTGNISINGSGNVMLDHIATIECKINGSGDVMCNKAGNPTIHINGSGNFRANEVYGKLKSKINGSGDIYLGSGHVDSFEARINGSGDIDAKNICTLLADLAIEGSGNITVGRVIEQSIEKHSKNSSIKILKRGKLLP